MSRDINEYDASPANCVTLLPLIVNQYHGDFSGTVDAAHEDLFDVSGAAGSCNQTMELVMPAVWARGTGVHRDSR